MSSRLRKCHIVKLHNSELFACPSFPRHTVLATCNLPWQSIRVSMPSISFISLCLGLIEAQTKKKLLFPSLIYYLAIPLKTIIISID